MGRSHTHSLEAQSQLTRLLALNALFDAARAGNEGAFAAARVQATVSAINKADLVDPASDADLQRCYSALLDASEPPAHLS
ncbi:hypothetical protein [Viridibacterium curvum]|uniref:Uncharacterized protein n=1 Tax=Viridibacterium curvum TaxID=1101404 RepID=A0ABP9QCC7_9RHOO